MKHWISLLLLFFTSCPVFSMQIEDPFRHLDHFYLSGPGRNYQEFVSCGSRTMFMAPVTSMRFICTGSPDTGGQTCRTVIIEDETRAEDITTPLCEDEQSVLLSSLGPVFRIKRKEYDNYHNDLRQLVLNRLKRLIQLDMHLRINNGRQQKMTLNRGKPNQKKIVVWNFTGNVTFPNYNSYEQKFLLTLSHQTPGSAHVVRFKMDNTLWLYLKDFSFAD